MKVKLFLFGFLLVLSTNSCKKTNPNFQQEAKKSEFVHRSMKKLTDIIVHDIFSPPVASRIYTYASIAGYEAGVNDYPEYRTLAGQVNGLKEVPKPEKGQEYCFPLASVHAFLTVGRTLIFSEEKMEEFQNQIYGEFRSLNMPDKVYEGSIAYGKQVADHILAWSKTDNYKETRTFPKYSINEEPGRWTPTPPSYMDAVEPHWNKIRPFVLDSANQFAPPPPTPFSADKNSQFYKEMMEVYSALNEDKEKRLEIAKFWDCNPYIAHFKGHVMFATKKITPGGHWINIAALAARQNNADFMKTLEAYALTSLALVDGFISCWDEKYRSNVIRPETAINKYIDENWQPTLQTPPFPEYTSGHSVISRSAAEVLTSIYGGDYGFMDNTEEEFGMPPRTFTSFLQASNEAAVSRMYGGIHYKPACFNGILQGEKVGKFVVGSIKTRNQIGQK